MNECLFELPSDSNIDKYSDSIAGLLKCMLLAIHRSCVYDISVRVGTQLKNPIQFFNAILPRSAKLKFNFTLTRTTCFNVFSSIRKYFVESMKTD